MKVTASNPVKPTESPAGTRSPTQKLGKCQTLGIGSGGQIRTLSEDVCSTKQAGFLKGELA